MSDRPGGFPRFREAFLSLTNKDMYNTAPFWGVHLGTTTIMVSVTLTLTLTLTLPCQT